MSEHIRLKHTYPVRNSDGEREATFEVLCPTNVFTRLGLNRKVKPTIEAPKMNPVAQEDYDPLRCIHTTNGKPCESKVLPPDVSKSFRHGWLCDKHTDEVYGSVAQLKLDVDRQIIADIIATEKRALKGTKRTVVQLSATEKIIYLG